MWESLLGVANRSLQYKPGGVAETFVCDGQDVASLCPYQSEVRASVGLVLANKYKGGPSTSDPESQTIQKILGFWANQLRQQSTSEETNFETFASLNTIAMNIIAGAIARQDKNVLDLIPVLKEAIAGDTASSEIVARSVGILVKDNDLLSAENHAVVRRFYKQWVYSHFAKPLYALALPGKEGHTAAKRYRTAILAIVSNCSFSVYEADLEPLTRLLITTLSDSSGSSGQTSPEQLVSALEVLVEILSNEPDVLKSHLKAIVSGALDAYDACLPENFNKAKGAAPSSAAKRDLGSTTARKLVLQALGALPKKFEERHLLPYAPRLQRTLALTCGDPIREVRQIARLARVNWAKVK